MLVWLFGLGDALCCHFRGGTVPHFLTLIPLPAHTCMHIHTYINMSCFDILRSSAHKCVRPAHGQKLNWYPLDRVHSALCTPGLYGNCSSGLHTLLYTYSSTQTSYDVFSDALPPESYSSQNDSSLLSLLALSLFWLSFSFILHFSSHFQFFTFPPFCPTHGYLVCHIFQVALGGTGFWRLEAECWIYLFFFPKL